MGDSDSLRFLVLSPTETSKLGFDPDPETPSGVRILEDVFISTKSPTFGLVDPVATVDLGTLSWWRTLGSYPKSSLDVRIVFDYDGPPPGRNSW